MTNNFVYARPRSATAAAHYARVCAVLRSGAERGWCTIGGEAVEFALGTVRERHHLVPTEMIQPVRWQDAAAFFEVGPEERHRARFDPRAICYMLSNHAVQAYANEHPGATIDAEETFFSYLIGVAGQTFSI